MGTKRGLWAPRHRWGAIGAHGHLGTYGDLWGPMWTYRDLWGYMGSYGDLSGRLMAYGGLWGPMGTYGSRVEWSGCRYP